MVTTIKGDWKWLVQAVNLPSMYNKDAVCFRCLASKGLSHPYIDVSANASWRATIGVQDPRLPSEEPALKHLRNFSFSSSSDWRPPKSERPAPVPVVCMAMVIDQACMLQPSTR